MRKNQLVLPCLEILLQRVISIYNLRLIGSNIGTSFLMALNIRKRNYCVMAFTITLSQIESISIKPIFFLVWESFGKSKYLLVFGCCFVVNVIFCQKAM